MQHYCCVQMLLAEERRLSGLRSEATRRVEIAEQALSAKDRQVEERVRAAAGADDALRLWLVHSGRYTLHTLWYGAAQSSVIRQRSWDDCRSPLLAATYTITNCLR
jgi:hypothetical protein